MDGDVAVPRQALRLLLALVLGVLVLQAATVLLVISQLPLPALAHLIVAVSRAR